MPHKYRCISNKNIVVSLAVTEEQVIVQNQLNGHAKTFAGYPQLIELYDEFENSCSDFTSFDDAKNHFTPNILQTIING